MIILKRRTVKFEDSSTFIISTEILDYLLNLNVAVQAFLVKIIGVSSNEVTVSKIIE